MTSKIAVLVSKVYGIGDIIDKASKDNPNFKYSNNESFNQHLRESKKEGKSFLDTLSTVDGFMDKQVMKYELEKEFSK